jgi:hypothetical protein
LPIAPAPDASTIATVPLPPGREQALRPADNYGFAALTFYLFLSALFFGRALSAHLFDHHVGVEVPSDVSNFVWALTWWRHALLNHLNPFHTTAVWAPGTTNLAWVTNAPLASAIAIPATSAFGPVATCNFLFILGPALSAWTAFILCQRISNSYLPAIVGGYIFGFLPTCSGRCRGMKIPARAGRTRLRTSRTPFSNSLPTRRWFMMLAALRSPLTPFLRRDRARPAPRDSTP